MSLLYFRVTNTESDASTFSEAQKSREALDDLAHNPRSFEVHTDRVSIYSVRAAFNMRGTRALVESHSNEVH